jgi:hypothetical protein
MNESLESSSPGSVWSAYFWLLAVLFTLSFFRGVTSFVDLVLGIVNAFALAGVWGYIRQVAVGWRLFWVFYFVFSALGSLVGFIALIASVDCLDFGIFAILGCGALLVAPMYLALWRYAFRSPCVWAR